MTQPQGYYRSPCGCAYMGLRARRHTGLAEYHPLCIRFRTSQYDTVLDKISQVQCRILAAHGGRFGVVARRFAVRRVVCREDQFSVRPDGKGVETIPSGLTLTALGDSARAVPQCSGVSPQDNYHTLTTEVIGVA